jgi:hypothetical protein
MVPHPPESLPEPIHGRTGVQALDLEAEVRAQAAKVERLTATILEAGVRSRSGREGATRGSARPTRGSARPGPLPGLSVKLLRQDNVGGVVR